MVGLCAFLVVRRGGIMINLFKYYEKLLVLSEINGYTAELTDGDAQVIIRRSTLAELQQEVAMLETMGCKLRCMHSF